MNPNPKFRRQTIRETHLLEATLREIVRQIDRRALFKTLPTAQELRAWADQLALVADLMTDFVCTADAALFELATSQEIPAVIQKCRGVVTARFHKRHH